VIGPLVVPCRTTATIDVGVDNVTDADVPLICTNGFVPKFVPVMVTEVPIGPLVGLNPVITGPDTVKLLLVDSLAPESGR
jgi:hypothetical protein